jgi:hypothetical protein
LPVRQSTGNAAPRALPPWLLVFYGAEEVLAIHGRYIDRHFVCPSGSHFRQTQLLQLIEYGVPLTFQYVPSIVFGLG